MQSERGFVFISILIFLQIFSLLSMYELLAAANMMKRIGEQEQHEKYVLTADQCLKELEAGMPHSIPACIIQTIPSAELARKPLTWWQQHTCHANSHQIQYYYAIEALGRDDCGMVDDSSVANYYRNTIYLLANKLKHAHIVLQSTIVLADHANSSCQRIAHHVKLGRQMSREI